MKTLDKISSFFTRTLERLFFNLGYGVASYPWTTIIVSSIIFLTSLSGLLLFHRTTDYEILWAPSNTNAIKNKYWVQDNFPKDSRMEYVITESPNVLEMTQIQYLFKVDKKLRSINSTKYKKDFNDLCLKYAISCIYRSILQIWEKGGIPDEETIMNLTDEQIQTDVTKAWNEKTFDLVTLLNEPTFSNDKLVSAKGALSIWLLKNNASVYAEGDLPRDEVAEDWEMEALNFLTKKLDHQPDITDGIPIGAMMYSFTERSFQDEIVTSIDGGMYVFGVGFTLILLFSLFVTSDFHPVNQRVMLLFIGFTVIGMAIGASFGLGFYMGVIYADLHPIIPFLLLGIGVDDIFIIIKSTDILSDEEKKLPLKDRVGLVIQHSGVSITVTSLTDLIAFLISSTTSIPLLRAFCISVALGITFLYFFVITFFTAWYTLDERRIQERKAFPWGFSRSFAMSEKKSSCIHNLYESIYVGYIFKRPVQILLSVISLLIFGFGLYGTLNITKDYNPITYMRQTSYQVKFIEAKDRLYPQFGDLVDIYVGNIKYWEYSKEMMKIDEIVSSCKFVRPGSHSDFWYKKVQEKCKKDNLDCTEEIQFKKAVGLAGLEDLSIFGNLKLNISITDDLQALQDGQWHIQASRSKIQYGFLKNVDEQIKAMDAVVGGMETIVFEDSDFVSPIAKSLAYHQWTANKVISKELIRNLALNFACITLVLFILLANIQLSIIVLIVVAMTITEIAGFAYFVDLHIEIVTSLELIISVGLVLDYSAHIGVCYTIQKTGNRFQRSKRSLLDMGPAIFSGGFSTFLAFVILFFNESYIFTSFCKMLGFGVLFGLWNALVFMPIVLCYLGTQPGDPYEKKGHDSLPSRVNLGYESYDHQRTSVPMEEKKNPCEETHNHSNDSKNFERF